MQDVLERLERKMDEGFARIDERFAKVDERFGGIDAQLHKQGVLLEALSADVKLALEGVNGNRQVLDDKFAELSRKLDERVQPVELASRHFARTLASTSERPRPKRRKA
ncbi:MAG: hypothetical protein AMXMBFR57_00040 [Acidimicrobiia bacterium]|jgi:hypothetical protein